MSNFPRDPVLTHPICSRGNLAAVELKTSRGGGEADDGASWNWRGSEEKGRDGRRATEDGRQNTGGGDGSRGFVKFMQAAFV